MKRIILAMSLILSLSMCVNYPSIPRVFGPGSFIPIGYLNENFNSLLSGITSGLYKLNINQLYINNSLFIDSNRNMTIGSLSVTGNAYIQGNLFVTGNIAATFNTLYANTIIASTENSIVSSINTLYVSSESVQVLNASTINATIVQILQRYLDKSGQVMPVGSILAYGGISAPDGWFLCDGTTKDKTTYSDLFTAISGNFGVTGNAFYLPDFRGRFLRGLDSITVSRDPDGLTRTAMNEGGAVSRNIGSIQSDQLESHTHTVAQQTDASHATGSANTLGVGAVVLSGATGGNETRPLNAYVNYIIKW